MFNKVKTYLDVKKEKAITIMAYKDLFATDDGKRVLKDLMKSCYVMQSTIDANPHEMAYNEGARSVVLRILSTINVDPMSLKEMIDGQSQE